MFVHWGRALHVCTFHWSLAKKTQFPFALWTEPLIYIFFEFVNLFHSLFLRVKSSKYVALSFLDFGAVGVLAKFKLRFDGLRVAEIFFWKVLLYKRDSNHANFWKLPKPNAHNFLASIVALPDLLNCVVWSLWQPSQRTRKARSLYFVSFPLWSC